LFYRRGTFDAGTQTGASIKIGPNIGEAFSSKAPLQYWGLLFL
jgi:hypothetical protein